MSTTTWPDLVAAAKQALRQPGSFDKRNGFLFFIYESTFGDEFSLWLSWEQDRLCHWERYTWEKDRDSAKFGVLEQLNYLVQSLFPTLRSTSGICGREELQPIVAFLESQAPTIRCIVDRSIVLDGETTTLTVGNANEELTYTWIVLPAEWTGLQEVKQQLLWLKE
jgi:hypothetical protein